MFDLIRDGALLKASACEAATAHNKDPLPSAAVSPWPSAWTKLTGKTGRRPRPHHRPPSSIPAHAE